MAATLTDRLAGMETLRDFLDNLAMHGDRIALEHFEAGDRREYCTYAELRQRVQSQAGRIIELDIHQGDHVGLMAEPSLQTTVAALAILRSGAVLTPIDTQLDQRALGHLLHEAAPRMVLGRTEQHQRIQQLAPSRTRMVPLAQLTREPKHSYELPDLSPSATAILFYTSATTGPPKGVPLTGRNILFQFGAVATSGIVAATDRILLPLPLHHVYPLVVGLLAPLSLGLRVILPAETTGPELIRAIREGDATAIIGVPRLYRALYEGIERKIGAQGTVRSMAAHGVLALAMASRRRLGIRVGGVLFRPVRHSLGQHLRVLACGGSALDGDLLLRLEALGWRLAIGYGLTETAPLLTVSPPGKAKPGSAGKPIRGVELRIDASAESKAHPGEGEILARGPGVFGGYYNLPEGTREAFTDDRWFRTDDLGYFDKQGHLHIVGRKSTVLVTESGENLQPDEIEERYAQHPFIEEAGVLQRKGKLVAVVVPNPERVNASGMSAIEAVRWAIDEQGAGFPSYKHIVDFVVSWEGLSRTRLGKLRRSVLAEQYERLSQGEDRGPARGHPIGIHEMKESDRDLLGSAAAGETWNILIRRFGQYPLTPDTSPQLELGIDSLGWLEITLEIRDQTGVELDEQTIGRVRKVRDLLKAVAERERGPAPEHRDPFENPEKQLDKSQRAWLKPLGLFRPVAFGLYLLNRLLMKVSFRVSAEGLEHLRSAGHCVIAPNHRSYLDAFVLSAVTPYRILSRTAWAGGVEVAFANPLNRFVSRMSRAVPITHGLRADADMALAAAVVDRKLNLIWFPEGRRELHRKLITFRPGIGLLLNRRPLPVVPAYITGTGIAMPTGRAIPRPVRVKITFGAPVTPDKLKEMAPDKDQSDARRIVAGLQAVMERLENRIAGKEPGGQPSPTKEQRAEPEEQREPAVHA